MSLSSSSLSLSLYSPFLSRSFLLINFSLASLFSVETRVSLSPSGIVSFRQGLPIHLSSLLPTPFRRFDTVEALSESASTLWLTSRFAVTENLFQSIAGDHNSFSIQHLAFPDDICCVNGLVRKTAAKALLLYLTELPEQVDRTLSTLNEVPNCIFFSVESSSFQLYVNLCQVRKLAARDIVRGKPDSVDPWKERLGVAEATLAITQVLHKEHAMPIVNMVW